MPDDVTMRRLARQLSAWADEVPLRPGSAARARATARRRQFRRRRAAVAATGVAIVGGSVGSVALLTRSPGSQLGTATASTAGGAAGATTTSIGGPGETAVTGSLPDGPAVTEAAPAMVWNAVHPDATEAVAGPFNSYGNGVASILPGLMVSTAPVERTRLPERQLWASEDGVSWTEGPELPGGHSSSAIWSDGDRIYAVGTLPASSGSMGARMSVSDDGGASWYDADVPLDDGALAALPDVSGVNAGVAAVVGAGDRVYVLINQRPVVDDPEFFPRTVRELGFDPARTSLTADGLFEVVCPGADDQGVPTTTVVENAMRVPVTEAAESAPTACGDAEASQRLITWDELGDGAATLRALVVPVPRLFATSDGESFEEVPLPDSVAAGSANTILASGDRLVYVTSDESGNHVATTEDGSSWSELPDIPFYVSTWNDWGGHLVAVGWTAADGEPVIVEETAGGWRTIRVAELYDGVAPNQGAAYLQAGDNGLTLAMTVPTEAADRSGPMTTEAGTDTGAPPATTLVVGPMGQAPAVRWELLHSDDGTSWSRESIAELAGVDDDEIAGIARIQQAGATVVVAVTLRAPMNEVPEQIVLVGTPTG